jgi:hypothetical protein
MIIIDRCKNLSSSRRAQYGVGDPCILRLREARTCHYRLTASPEGG